MTKSADAFRTISEVADWLETPAHVLRFWESKFSQVKPVKRAGGRRYYRPNDMLLLGGIKKLLHDDGMTIKGVQKLLRESGVAHVAEFSQPLGEASDDVLVGTIEEVAPLPFKSQKAKDDQAAKEAQDAEQNQKAPSDIESDPALEPDLFAEQSQSEGDDEISDDASQDEAPATDASNITELPSFLQRREPSSEDSTETENAALLQRLAEVPKDPSDDLEADAGPLKQLADLQRPVSRQVAAQLMPVMNKLRGASVSSVSD